MCIGAETSDENEITMLSKMKQSSWMASLMWNHDGVDFSKRLKELCDLTVVWKS
jgi:hypothetical protein